ncbi:DNA cytosine methyltransferase [Corynebacterium aquatimens]|uniref:DNA cytosine methyltransferase n=1 Tax=Corynebacterium aquatimens TaxID=1190508 RepID=UPI003313574C
MWGLSLGFQTAGFEILAGYDYWDKAISTYNMNVGDHAKLLDLKDLDECISELSSWGEPENFPSIIGGPRVRTSHLPGNEKKIRMRI